MIFITPAITRIEEACCRMRSPVGAASSYRLSEHVYAVSDHEPPRADKKSGRRTSLPRRHREAGWRENRAGAAPAPRLSGEFGGAAEAVVMEGQKHGAIDEPEKGAVEEEDHLLVRFEQRPAREYEAGQ
jgi:hypothetical protein